MTPEQLVERLSQALPERLKCVVLYGSAAAGDFVPGASNFNLLILVEPLTTAELDALRPATSQWRRAGNAAPLLFTPKELAASCDAFPIEMLDLQQSRRVLWGDDLLATIEVHPADLRLQVERELTGKLLALRGQYLAEDRPEAITELMVRSVSTILVLFRAGLRLYQDEVPPKKLDALHALRRHVTFDIQPFERLFELKQSKPNTEHGVTFDAYLKAIETVAKAIGEKSSD